MPTPKPTPALEDLEAAPRRQASVDAEAIRIVIHDVDSGSSATAAQRRVILRRDPTDKAHRSKWPPCDNVLMSMALYTRTGVSGHSEGPFGD